MCRIFTKKKSSDPPLADYLLLLSFSSFFFLFFPSLTLLFSIRPIFWPKHGGTVCRLPSSSSSKKKKNLFRHVPTTARRFHSHHHHHPHLQQEEEENFGISVCLLVGSQTSFLARHHAHGLNPTSQPSRLSPWSRMRETCHEQEARDKRTSLLRDFKLVAVDATSSRTTRVFLPTNRSTRRRSGRRGNTKKERVQDDKKTEREGGEERRIFSLCGHSFAFFRRYVCLLYRYLHMRSEREREDFLLFVYQERDFFHFPSVVVSPLLPRACLLLRL